MYPPRFQKKLNFANAAMLLMAVGLFSGRLEARLEKHMPDKAFLSTAKMRGDSTFPGQESFDVTLSDGYQVSTNNPSGIQWNNKNIRIEDGSTVHFDRNVTMEKCTVRVGSNSRIIIEGAYGLKTSNECLFTGCYAMWNGIEVSASSYVDLDDTEFWNARSTIFFKKDFNTYNTRIKNCTFKSNDIGIEVGRFQNNVDINTVFTPQQLHDNVFEGGNLITPLSGHKSFAGISLYKCAFAFIGMSGENTFKNLNVGIACRNTSAIISRANFSSMYIQFGTGGYGITSGESHLYVYGCHFSDDATGGVYSENAKSLSVLESEFAGEEQYGIFSENSTKLAYATIMNNVFTLNKAAEISAIYHERSPSGGLSSISDKVYNLIDHNDITVTNDHAKTHDISLIDVYSPFNGLNRFPIQNNIITVNSRSTPIHGIYVRGASNKLEILGNTLDYPGTPAPSQITATLGIAVEEVFGGSNKLDDNTITSTFWSNATPEEKTSYIKCGIHLYKSPGFQVCGNTLDDTYRAFHFAGDLSYCDFAVNNIGRHYHGIHCIKWLDGVQTNLGIQDWHENVWSTSASDYSGYAAKYDDAMSAPFTFKVDGSILGNMPPSISILNWVFNLPTGESNSNCVNSTDPPTHEITDADIEVMNETYPVESDAGQWDLERELLLKLLTSPELMPANSFEETWYESKENSSPWKFAKAEKAFLDAYEFPDQLQSGLDSLYSRYEVLRNDLLELDSLQRIDPYNIDNDILQDQVAASEAFEEVREAIDSLRSECDAYTLSGLADAEDLNDDLPDTAAYEANLKNVYEIAVKSALGNALTENDYDLLRAIAGQCPLEGGPAVRIAPYHLPHAETVSYLREEQGGEACEALERSQTGLSPGFVVSLAPNPAQDFINVRLPRRHLSTYSIYDATGKRQLESTPGILSVETTIEVKRLPAGIYFIRLTDDSAATYLLKFVINR